jgi:pyrrolidone-carboxylate peptidase
MGASCSVSESAADSWSVWTKDEKAENESAAQLQKVAGAYVSEFVYYGVPTNFHKKNANPTSPIIFEIDATIIEKYLAEDNVRRLTV